jgi:hypothetical protein
MSRNPFGTLKINRDDDDDEDYIKVNSKNTTSAGIHTSHTAMKKDKVKIKVRPENVRQEETNQVSEGFEVVGGKVRKQPYPFKNIEEEGSEVKRDNKKDKSHKGTSNNDRKFNQNRPQKRQYERHSGTGRGRETAKNGAGGKTVWGDNPEQIARHARNNYGSADDQCKFTKFFFTPLKNFTNFLILIIPK